jgi:hypothetical protein
MRKKSRRGGMLGLLNLRQGSGVTPDSDETVLRSRLGQNYGNCRPASGPREATGCRNRLLTGSDAAAESDLAGESLFLNRQLSFRRLLWVNWTLVREQGADPGWVNIHLHDALH